MQSEAQHQKESSTRKNSANIYAITFILITILSLLIIFNITWSFRDQALRDFGSFVAAGQTAQAGRDPYGKDEPLVFFVEFKGINVASKLPNLNPPFSVILFQPLANLDPVQAFSAWRWISVGLYLLGLIVLLKTYPAKRNLVFIGWALNTIGLWHTVELGQIYMPLFLLAVLAWVLLLRDRPPELLIGILLGVIVAIKPNYAVWPLFLFLIGHKRTVLSALTTAILLSLLPALFYGPGIYLQWIQASRLFSGLGFLGNSSFTGLFTHLSIAGVGTLLGFIVLIGVALYVWKKKPSIELTSALALTLSLLASPIAWAGYTVMLLPIFVYRKWDALLSIAGVILLIPFMPISLIFQESLATVIIVGWTYGWALLLMLIALLRDTKRPILQAS